MDIVKYIVEILIDNDQVVIPGLGVLKTEYKSAIIHPVDHSFNPPAKALIFTESTSDDKLLTKRISEGENISIDEAENEIKTLVDVIHSDIEKKKIVVVEGLGSFSLDSNNKIIFKTDDNNLFNDSFGLTDFQSPAIVRNDFKEMAEAKIAEEKEKVLRRRKRNRRIIFATGIAALLVAFLYVYYFTDIFNSLQYQNKTIIVNDIPKAKPKVIVVDTIVKDTTKIIVQQNQDTLKKEKGVITNNHTVTDSKSSTGVMYYIIAGSFKVEENANTWVAKLKAKGYPNAGVIKPTNSTLFVTYYNSYNNKEQATIDFKKINTTLDKEAWIMKK